MLAPSIIIDELNITVNACTEHNDKSTEYNGEYTQCHDKTQGRRERGQGGAKYLGQDWLGGGRNLGKTSGHGCYCQDG